MRINDYKDNRATGKPDILDWTYYAITILSDEVREACKGSNIQLMEFSRDKEEYIGINFSNEINISNGKNTEEENMTERQKVDAIVSSASGYPLDSEDKLSESNLEMDSEEMSEDNNDKSESMSNDTEINEGESKDNMEIAESENLCDSNNNEAHMDDSSEDKDSDVEDDANDEDDNDDEPDDDDKKQDEDFSNEKCSAMSLNEAMSEIERLSDENKRLKSDNEVYMSKLESMSDYNELKEFKRMADEERLKEEKMSEVNAIMSQIAERGINMSDEDKNYLLSKVEDYDDVSAWGNMAKATIFDKYDTTNFDIQRIGMPYQTNQMSHSASVWDRIKNKF